MKCYYWESEYSWGYITVNNDGEAIRLCKRAVATNDKLLTVHKKNEDTPLGFPLIVVWEEK